MELTEDFALDCAHPKIVGSIIDAIRELNPDLIYENISLDMLKGDVIFWFAEEKKIDSIFSLSSDTPMLNEVDFLKRFDLSIEWHIICNITKIC